MKNLLNLLLLSLIVIGCSSAPVKKPEIKPVVEAPVVVEPAPAPVQVKSFYKVESTLKWVAEAAKIADCVTVQKGFHQDILAVENYTHYSGTNQAIVNSLLSPKVARVSTYKKKFTKARAYRNIGSDKIWLNRAKIFRADAALIDTKIHERLHVLGYGHKGNNRYAYNNEQSVPYKVGYLARKYFEVCKNDQ